MSCLYEIWKIIAMFMKPIIGSCAEPVESSTFIHIFLVLVPLVLAHRASTYETTGVTLPTWYLGGSFACPVTCCSGLPQTRSSRLPTTLLTLWSGCMTYITVPVDTWRWPVTKWRPAMTAWPTQQGFRKVMEPGCTTRCGPEESHRSYSLYCSSYFFPLFCTSLLILSHPGDLSGLVLFSCGHPAGGQWGSCACCVWCSTPVAGTSVMHMQGRSLLRFVLGRGRQVHRHTFICIWHQEIKSILIMYQCCWFYVSTFVLCSLDF
jgi:hypothetical protein